ncbi:Phosphatidyl serine synthase, putative [Angomonas deanei]|uniref:Phosphatidyl serine synthase, putative n=1 Tax=Angomonas deanei TaxID=59799 RepID=A0A7G2CLD2_9TRYP|nr:Phosphatidyl serine synthase, putative [Angomonas deanei]
MLTVLLLLLRYHYFPYADTNHHIKIGVAAACFSFVGFGALHLPDSLMVRPHPAVWRSVLACGILYIVFLTYLLFQDLESARKIFVFFDPSLAKPLPERHYAEDCRMSTPEEPYLFLKTAVFDIFVIAHSLGYVFKALILRDWRVVTCVSLGFEVIEVTFQHILPNFRECWWDHILLDVLICNAGGTVAGIYLLRFLNAKQYEWIALKEIPTVKGKAQRVLRQFTPRSFEVYQWNIFQSPKRFLQVVGILGLMFIQEVNCFTSKSILWMQPEHPLVVARLALWSFMAMPGLREYYEYMTNPEVKRIGTTAWVTTYGLLLETLVIGKWIVEGGYFREQMPTHVLIPWLFFVPAFSIWFALYFGCLSSAQREQRKGIVYYISNIFFCFSVLCIVGLFCMGLPDLQIGRKLFEDFFRPYESTLLFWR